MRGAGLISLSLMQPEFPVDCLELRWLDQLAMRHAHRMQRPLELLLPEGQPLLAHSGHLFCAAECPLMGVKRTSRDYRQTMNLTRGVPAPTNIDVPRSSRVTDILTSHPSMSATYTRRSL
jgi:hypothetical protein